MQIIRLKDSQKWDEIVTSFPQQDIYYLSGYVKSFELHGDGQPILLYYKDDLGRAICVLMLRDISDDILFKGIIPKNTFKDAVTPYGYGGFMLDGKPNLQKLEIALKQVLTDLEIISVFYRFHPVLKNCSSLNDSYELISLGKTIAMDLSSPDVIWENIISKNRNMIRKAEKMGVEIKHGKGKELLKVFREIYNSTMEHDNAEAYYYFDEDFYNSIDDGLHDNYEIFYAVYQGDIIAMSIMIFANCYMNYHLSGSKIECRSLAPSNLLLYKAALWGSEKGFKTLHLGGGFGSGEDSLYKFKAAFNRNSDYRFAIGKSIINQEKYNYLLALRNFTKEQESKVSFFPSYRANI